MSADPWLPVVVVTRPEPQAGDWVARLQALGAPALALPLLRIVPASTSAGALAQAWRQLAGPAPVYRLLMFVSPNAVAQFFAPRPLGLVWPAGVIAAATGPGTQAALMGVGVPPDQIAAPRADAPSFDAEALWRDALAALPWVGQRVLVVRGDGGRDWLAETLTAAGAEVSMLCAYHQLGPAWEAAELARLAEVLAAPVDHVWLFSSSQAVRHLVDRLDQAGQGAARAAMRRMVAITSHERIATTAMTLGLAEVHTCAPRPVEVVATLRQIMAAVTKMRR
ncbi:MAG: hypothetical protein RIQ60_356 [Pseudomonadota bacterium]|jgi:uroporphyrinogen-III synthase